MRALVVEDNPSISGFISRGLRESGWAVDVATEGIQGFELAQRGDHDIIVLDLMLPGKDGFSIIRDLRRGGSRTPIICLTARDAVDDRVKGLDMGADDYLAKPFSFVELLARLRALLRRGPTLTENPIVVGDLTIDLVTRQVQRGGRRVNLSAREFSLLEYLARNQGHVLTRTMILERVWDINQDPLTNVVDVHINRLRKKIDHGCEQSLIHTIRGVGYVLRQD